MMSKRWICGAAYGLALAFVAAVGCNEVDNPASVGSKTLGIEKPPPGGGGPAQPPDLLPTSFHGQGSKQDHQQLNLPAIACQDVENHMRTCIKSQDRIEECITTPAPSGGIHQADNGWSK